MIPAPTPPSPPHEIATWLDSSALRPDPTRTDWDTERERLEDLWRRVERELAPVAGPAYREIRAPPMPPADAADLLVRLFALFRAAGEEARAARCVVLAASIAAEDHPLHELIRCAKDESTVVCGILLAQRDARRDDLVTHDYTLRRVRRKARSRALRAMIDRMLDGSRPVSFEPGLITLHGVGALFYGARDHRDDGSYVTTRFFVVAGLPVVPLDAWRVTRAPNGAYRLLSREPLKRWARYYRRALLCVVLVGLAALLAYPR